MKNTIFTAPEIECQGCASAIKKSVGTVAGVDSVQVDVESKRVTITHAETASPEALKAAVEKAGFSALSD